jgi:threonine aldolase
MDHFDQQAAQARIADQVKFDVLTDSQDSDNAAHMRKVSRSFICEYRSDI